MNEPKDKCLDKAQESGKHEARPLATSPQRRRINLIRERVRVYRRRHLPRES